MLTVRSADSVPAGGRIANVGIRVAVDGRVAPPGGVAFDPPTCQGRTKADAPCGGKRAKGTMFCAGHLRQRGEL